MTPYKAEDYIEFIATGRMEKVSPRGLELIAIKFRELEKEASDEHVKWLLDRHFEMSESMIEALDYFSLPWYKQLFTPSPDMTCGRAN